MTPARASTALCGSLVIGGFPGTSLPATFAAALREQRRGGAILFRRNLTGELAQVADLVRAIHASSGPRPLVCIDQEGGRVARLGAPLLEVPAMRAVASCGDESLAERIAHAVGAELAALGITLNCAPVVDVDTRSDNPIIGDRSFGSDPERCARFGAAWIRGLQSAGLLACAKHFPGHGDTSKDSHVDLPFVDRSVSTLEQVELVPFRAAVAAGVATMMTAHVVYPAIDPQRPATLSAAACTRLRDEVGFAGMLVSDDLGMQAIVAHHSIGEASVQAVAAGCDALLICPHDDFQESAVEALVREAEVSAAFRARCEQARARIGEARRRIAVGPPDDAAIARTIGGSESRAIASLMATRLAT